MSTTHIAHSTSESTPPGSMPTPSQRAFIGLVGSAALWSMALPGMAQAPSQPAAAPGSAAASMALPADAAPALQLSLGHQHVLQPAMALARIAVGDPNVLDVKVLRSVSSGASQSAELLLTPKAPGSTTLSVWPAKGLPQSWKIQVSGPSLLLKKRLESVPEHARALAELRLNAPDKAPLIDRSQVAVRSNTVQVDVQVVEFKKSALKRAGINLISGGPNGHGFSFGMYTPGSSTGSSSSSGSEGSTSSSSAISSAMNLVLGFGKAFGGNGLSAQMGFLEGNGLARVLAKPTLVAHTGQSASFLAGGEIPIPVPSSASNNISIRYKEFGVKLQLTPTILSDDRIALKVAPEASDLDYTSGVTISGISVPALVTRRADTMVELADGESFVIGGLVSRATSSSVNKVPLLGDLPILGAFFKNLNYSQDEKELVIIVTPRLVQPLPANTNLEALLPGNRSEQPNAGQVWGPYLGGGLSSNAALPGFSN
ncbi:type II and III secretion system protein family protein [Comamonas sp. Y6]|uniref:Type II and III secretion system protein family protein n=1 Tax=Comamonas resistens TaxID=3046670 RepID=A0ABY8SQT1_9BURK|nr:type II and III secretion system protein family protein [Comamonas resistens]MDL5035899.1 type II and III secretion system protein family protein [Comamonas resistens]WHS65303.1 type II and III secretion system protein family protein [Comamonas resistens]